MYVDENGQLLGEIVWNTQVIADAIRSVQPGLDWPAVIRGLDNPEFYVVDQRGLSIVVDLYRRSGCHEPFPADFFLTPWRHPSAQLSFLRASLFVDPSVFTFEPGAATPNAAGSGGEFNPWLYPPFVEAFLRISEYPECSTSVRALFESLIKPMSEELLYMMYEFKENYALKRDILIVLENLFFSASYNPTIVNRIWSRNRQALLSSLCNLYLRDVDKLSHILDITHQEQRIQDDDGIFEALLDTKPYIFAIDLATLASTREYLNLDLWLRSKMQKDGKQFIETCVTYLFLKLRQRAGANVMLSKFQLTADAFTIFMNNLQVYIPAQLFATTKELAYIYNEYVKLVQFQKAQQLQQLQIQQAQQQQAQQQMGMESVEQSIYNSQQQAQQQFQQIMNLERQQQIQHAQAQLQAQQQQIQLQQQRQQQQQLQMQQAQQMQQMQQMQQAQMKAQNQMASNGAEGGGEGEMMQNEGEDGGEGNNGSSEKEDGNSGGGDDEAAGGEDGKDDSAVVPIGCLGNGDLVEYFVKDATLDDEKRADICVQYIYDGVLTAGEFADILKRITTLEKGDEDKDKDKSAADYEKRKRKEPRYMRLVEKFFGEVRLLEKKSYAQADALGETLGTMVHRSAIHREDLLNGLSCVLQLISGAPGTRSFRFATTAIAQFYTDLYKWKNYTTKLSQVPNLENFAPGVYGLIAYGRAGSLATASLATTAASVAVERAAGGVSPAAGAAADNATRPYLQPDKFKVSEYIQMIFNNLSQQNLGEMVKGFRGYFDPGKDSYDDLALSVLARVLNEANHHGLYAAFIFAVGSAPLTKRILRFSYRKSAALLAAFAARYDGSGSPAETAALKQLHCLGNWLGALTLARDTPLLRAELDVLGLVRGARGSPAMSYVMPFVSDVLVHCASSTAFRPPNAWIVAVLDALADILGDTLALKQKVVHEIRRIFEALAVDPADFGSERRRRHKPLRGTAAGKKSKHAGKRKIKAQGEDSTISITPPPASALGLPSTSSGSPEPTSSSSSSSDSESPPLVESPEVPGGCGARSEEPHEFICEVLRRSVKVSNALRVLGGAVAPALLFRETVNATARIVEMICRGEVPNAVSTAVGTTKALVLKDFAGDGREERFVEACTTMAKALASEVILISCKHTLRQLMADALAVMLCDLCGPNTPELLLGDVAKLLVHDNFDAACAAVARRAETVAEAEILEATRAERAERRAHWQENGVTARFRGKPGAKPLTERQLNVYRDFGATPVILSTPDLSKTSDAEQKQKQKQQETQQQQDSQQQQQQQQQQEPEDPAAAAAAKKEEMLKVAVARVKGALNAEKVFSDDADAHIRTDVGSQYLLFLKKLTSVCAQLPPDQDIRQLPQSHALFGVLSEFAQIIVDALHILVTNSRARLQQAIQTRREKINRSRIARRARLRLQRRRHHEAIMGITMGAEFDTAAATAAPSSTAAFLTAGGVVNREGAMGIIGNSHVDVDEIDFISSSDEVDDDDDDDDILDDIDDDEEEEDEEDDGDAEDNYIRIDDIDEEEEMMMSDRETMRCIEECMSVIRPVFRHLVDGNARRPLQDAVFMLLAQCGEDAVEYTTQCYMALSFEKLVTPDLLARLIGYRLVSVPTIDDFLSAKLQTPGAQSAAQALRNLAAQVLYVFVCSHKIPANDFSKTITVCNGLAPQVQVFAASLKIKEAEDQQKAQQQAALQAQLQAKLQAAAASNDEARYTIPCIIAFNEWCDALEAYGENDVTRVFLQLQAIIQVCRDTFFNKAFLVAMETYWFAPPGSAARCVKLNAYGNLVIRLCQYVSKDPNAQVQYFVRSLRTFVVEFMEKGSEDPRPFLYLLNYWAAHYDQFPNNNNNGSSGNGGNNGGNPAAAAAAGEQGGRVKEPLDVFFNVLVSYIHPSKNPLLAYGWLEIISQEALLRRVLQNRQNWGMMQRQLVLLLRFLSLSVTTLGTAYAAGTIDAPASEQLHAYIKEVVALFIKIQNMCPAFLAAYHFSLCNAIPENFVNLRNIILASSPVMVPSPFTNIVVERIPESNMAPLLADNYMTVLEQRIPIDALTACVRDPTGAPYFWVQTSLFPLLDAPSDPAKRVEAATVFNALVLCLGDLAVRTPELKNAIYFVIKRLILILPPNGSLALINAMANQLRFPNVHTIYFSKILITFFSSICSPEYTKEQITRVLCERIQRSQVQPWGIMVTCTELLLNQKYDIFSCEFINEYPLIAKTLRTYRDKFKKLFTQQKLQIQQQQQQQQQQLQAQQVQQQQQQQIY